MIFTEGGRLSDLLKFEVNKDFCRDTVTVAAGQNLKMGTVVGTKSATGQVKIVSIDPEEEDGSDEATGIILEDADATAGAKKAVVLLGCGMVAYDYLVFPAAATDVQKKKILKGLLDRIIRVIKSV